MYFFQRVRSTDDAHNNDNTTALQFQSGLQSTSQKRKETLPVKVTQSLLTKQQHHDKHVGDATIDQCCLRNRLVMIEHHGAELVVLLPGQWQRSLTHNS